LQCNEISWKLKRKEKNEINLNNKIKQLNFFSTLNLTIKEICAGGVSDEGKNSKIIYSCSEMLIFTNFINF